jgi:pyruvate,water dikinase
MLIHGAIIARKYGIPCVTGIPDATSIIKTGSKMLHSHDRNNIIYQPKEPKKKIVFKSSLKTSYFPASRANMSSCYTTQITAPGKQKTMFTIWTYHFHSLV